MELTCCKTNISEFTIKDENDEIPPVKLVLQFAQLLFAQLKTIQKI